MNKYLVLQRLIEAVEKILMNDKKEQPEKQEVKQKTLFDEEMTLSKQEEDLLFREMIQGLEVIQDDQ